MAKKHSSTKRESPLSQADSKVALEATYELSSILGALKKYAAFDLSTGTAAKIEPAIVRASMVRCVALNSIVMSILGGDGRPLADMRDEVAHG
jgi:hypothetical protein